MQDWNGKVKNGNGTEIGPLHLLSTMEGSTAIYSLNYSVGRKKRTYNSLLPYILVCRKGIHHLNSLLKFPSALL